MELSEINVLFRSQFQHHKKSLFAKQETYLCQKSVPTPLRRGGGE